MTAMDRVVSGLVARLDKVEQEWLTRAHHPDHASEEDQHYYWTHPWWEYAETAEREPPEGEGWQSDDRGHGLIPWVEYEEWSDARGDYVSYGRWAWRRRRETPREFVPEGDAAQVLGLVRASRDLIDQWRAARAKYDQIRSGLEHGVPLSAHFDCNAAQDMAAALVEAVRAVARGWGVADNDKEAQR